MRKITVTHPKTGEKHSFEDEQQLRKFLNEDLLSFKDKRFFKLQAQVRVAPVGNIPEILDGFGIENE